MKTTITRFGMLSLMLLFVSVRGAFGQTTIFSENFESGTANTAWGNYYKGEDSVKAKPMAQAPKVLSTGGSYVGWLQDINGSYTGAAVAVTGALNLKDYSIEADVYCYVGQTLSAYSGLIVYADSSKKDFYKMRVDFDASDRINFSGLKADPNTFLPLFSKDFKGVDNPGLFPTTDGWHKMKVEIRNTSTTVTSIWCYFDGTLLTGCPITDTTSTRVTSGGFGLYSFQQSATGLASYFDNIIVKTFSPATSVEHNGGTIPSEFRLSQNYPNPFNPSTNLTYQVAKEGFVSVKIYNVLGQAVATLVNEVKQAGTYHATWNASGFGSGIYFCRMQTGSITESRKMVLMK